MKLVPEIKAALDATGLPWTTEGGGNHIKLKLAGRLVGISPMRGKRAADPRVEKNIIAQIKRAAVDIKRDHGAGAGGGGRGTGEGVRARQIPCP